MHSRERFTLLFALPVQLSSLQRLVMNSYPLEVHEISTLNLQESSPLLYIPVRPVEISSLQRLVMSSYPL